MLVSSVAAFFFFFNDTATTEIYTLSLHDALPISVRLEHVDDYLNEFTFRFNRRRSRSRGKLFLRLVQQAMAVEPSTYTRSEEHTSELQSQSNLVCRLLLEKKKTDNQSRLSCTVLY